MNTDDRNPRFYAMLLNMGMVAGALADDSVMNELVQSLQERDFNAGHLARLRDQLTLALQRSGHDKATPPSPDGGVIEGTNRTTSGAIGQP